MGLFTYLFINLIDDEKSVMIMMLAQLVQPM